MDDDRCVPVDFNCDRPLPHFHPVHQPALPEIPRRGTRGHQVDLCAVDDLSCVVGSTAVARLAAYGHAF